MGFFSKLIGNKASDAKSAMKKVENRDLMEAIVGGCLLIAAADGEIEPSEVEKIDQLIRSNESLAHFGAEITTVLTRFTEQLKAGFLVGRVKIMREIGDIKNNPRDAEEVFVNMIVVAQADGQIEPEETKVLVEVGRVLGLRPSDYGIEG